MRSKSLLRLSICLCIGWGDAFLRLWLPAPASYFPVCKITTWSPLTSMCLGVCYMCVSVCMGVEVPGAGGQPWLSLFLCWCPILFGTVSQGPGACPLASSQDLLAISSQIPGSQICSTASRLKKWVLRSGIHALRYPSHFSNAGTCVSWNACENGL